LFAGERVKVLHFAKDDNDTLHLCSYAARAENDPIMLRGWMRCCMVPGPPRYFLCDERRKVMCVQIGSFRKKSWSSLAAKLGTFESPSFMFNFNFFEIIGQLQHA
jgi:hypothetical protein